MNILGKTLGALAFLVASAGVGSAAVVYDSGLTIPDLNFGTVADPSAPPVVLSAQRATFATQVSITGAGWTGLYSTSVVASDSFTLNVYADAAGTPGALISSHAMTSSRTGSGSLLLGSEVFDYDGTFSSVALASGSYWFSVLNDTVVPSTAWIWTGDAILAPAGDGFLAGQPGSVLDWDLTLTGEEVVAPVPLPASLPALAGALILLGAWRRRS